MKTLILVLLMSIITLTCTAQRVINNSIYNIDYFVNDCLADLGVTDTSIVITINKPCNAKSTNCLVHYDITPFNYNIYISPDVDYVRYCLILAHEIVHVKQLVNDEITFRTVARYDAIYDAMYKYDIKFENEANAIGKDLVKKYLKFKL